MPRPVTLFWASGPTCPEELGQQGARVGLDGLELACWGDHFEVDKRSTRTGLRRRGGVLLERTACAAISDHLVGQAVCDRSTSAPGDPAARGLGRRRPRGRRAARRERDEGHRAFAPRLGVGVVNGFTGSAIWHQLYSFPPNDFAMIERATGTSRGAGTRSSTSSRGRACASALEVHPTEIAYDFSHGDAEGA